MPRPAIILPSLVALAFALATWLKPRHSEWEGDRRQNQGILAVILGDGRRVFGDYFFRKADIYFHSGVYPSMFDRTASLEENHMASVVTGSSDSNEEGHDEGQDPEHEGATDVDHNHDHDHDHEHEELPARTDAPIDWLDRFSRNFYPTRHVHLNEGADAREILPWIRMSAELDPERVATYTTAAFWLRRYMHKIDEAEHFLREGLRANPGNPEILFELGRLDDEDRHDLVRARNLYGLALREWQKKADPQEEDVLLLRQIVAHLARLEETQGNLPQAIQYWQSLIPSLKEPAAVRQRIAELQSKLNGASPNPAP